MSDFDAIFVLPYPFSDHPSFPEGILKRALECEGFRVGVIDAPFWQNKESFAALGRPKLFFAIVPGPVDSVVLNYTSTRKRRREDLYQMGGKAYFSGYPPSIKYKIRPDRTTLIFSNRIKEVFRGVPVIIGGVEATLRRFCHYDFQQDRIRRSFLLDSRADILVTGIGEKQLVRIAHLLRSGVPIQDINLRGTVKLGKPPSQNDTYFEIPSLEDIEKDRSKLLEAHLLAEKARWMGKGVVQRHGDQYVVENPPEVYLSGDLDEIYGLPFTRMHPEKKGCSPALRMNLFSVTSHRGCGGGCAFCAINIHEGKRIISRSMDSILSEVQSLTQHPNWRGYVSDIGGATGEFYGADCAPETCKKPSCLYPTQCRRLYLGQKYLELLKASRKVKGVKKIFVGSGIRYDLVMKAPELLEEIMAYHSGKHLRIAPEHTETRVLELMRKPSFEVLVSFVRLVGSINQKLRRKIELAPYFIVGHPGETFRDVVEMKKRLKSLGLKIRDVQIFTPSPGTLATAMYFAGISSGSTSIPVEKNILELQKRKRFLMDSDS